MAKLFIKNMVCPRCVESVRQLLVELAIPYTRIQLGEVVLPLSASASQERALAKGLEKRGFALLDDRDSRLVNAIKTFIIERVHYGRHRAPQKLSVLLAQHVQKEYSSISKTFSRVEGITIDKFTQLQKVEKVKELLSYDELSIAAIADELEYSSGAHLSRQFKKISGMAPSAFRQLHAFPRRNIDQVRPDA